ncbi:hypothetical protein JRO89_XS09G0229500 [Xanthoceras sorbifolium]|uniref:DUF4220 domain-containing protein n=1 Tax=Xanthoceras sorbifolium TaxID=99658 RepID=A0ABQ8HMU5_9ROSI|nr:hypothetical protein JRO89_XS09G0229500 [Xanthoceras sorbifolium]
MGIEDLLTEKATEKLNGLEIRFLIFLSLVLQIILILFGARRKYTARNWIRILVWSSYMILHWVVTVALGHISNNQRDISHQGSSSTDPPPTPNNKLQEFWTPFLLVHLGGPDTITAYALEDNDMWLRHLLLHGVHVGTSVYIFVQAWERHPLMFVGIPILISGIINYGGKILALRSSSTQYLKDSLFSAPDSCSEFVKQIEKKGTSLELGDQGLLLEVTVSPEDGIDPKDHPLVEAYFVFKRLEYLFAGLVLEYYDRIGIYSIIKDKSAEDCFKLVAIELGFMYDTLYTKTTIVCSRLGIVFHCIGLFSSFSALLVFSIMNHVIPGGYSNIDIFLTYALLIGAVFLEVYASIILFYSDWTRLWLIKCKKGDHNLVSKTLVDHLWRITGPSHDRHHSLLSNHRKRWSGSMAQFNLISFCLKSTQQQQRRCKIGVHILPYISKLSENFRYLIRENVNADLQEMIFSHLKMKGDKLIVDNVSYVKSRNEFLAHRGDNALEKWHHLLRDHRFHWSTTQVEFDRSLLIWHIATDLCYSCDLDHVNGDDNKLHPKCKTSKHLSEYMLYLLVFCPSMLPKGPIGEIRYADTCAEAMEFFKKKNVITGSSKRRDIFEEFLREDTKEDHHLLSSRPESEAARRRSGRRNQSVLYQGCKLTRQFLELGTQTNGTNAIEKWEIISEVWVEMVAYAANRCGWKEHCQQLRRGGELLTHVCLLMVHLGLSKQFVDTV